MASTWAWKANPPSPVSPAVPVPASVVMRPVVRSTTRTAPDSATYRRVPTTATWPGEVSSAVVAATPSEVSAPPPATVEMRWVVPSTLRTRPLVDSTMKTSFAASTDRSVGAVS